LVFESGVQLVETGLPVILTISHAPNNAEHIRQIDNPASVYFSAGALHIAGPDRETIRIYSAAGTLLQIADKQADVVVIPIRKNTGYFLIVRGSTGWAKKIINF